MFGWTSTILTRLGLKVGLVFGSIEGLNVGDFKFCPIIDTRQSRMKTANFMTIHSYHRW